MVLPAPVPGFVWECVGPVVRLTVRKFHTAARRSLSKERIAFFVGKRELPAFDASSLLVAVNTPTQV